MPDILDSLLHAPDWYQALSLAERAAAPRPAGDVASATAPTAEAAARAARRLERWRAQSPFTQDGYFQRRLAHDRLDIAGLAALLGETPGDLAARAGGTGDAATRPAWLAELAASFTAPPPTPAAPRFPFAATAHGRQGPLLAVVRPLLDRGFARLSAALAALADRSGTTLFVPDQAAELLAIALPSRLLYQLGRVFAVELHLASEAGQLAGATPEERHASFVARLSDPATALALLCQYPVAARQTAETVTRWVDAGIELFTHLVADAPRLAEQLAEGRSLGTLTDLSGGLGDLHRGGRSVTLLRFDSGLALIYKPRSMAVEASFQDLLDWTNRRGFAPGFARLRVVTAGDHGWAEVVSARPCADAAEIERFYQRQGGYLALLYALSATDMHHENLIAVGEHPYLVDLEALFHPFDQAWGRPSAGETRLPDSVLRVGLLPSSWGGKDDRDGIDLSGLAATSGQMMPRPVLRTKDPGTDRMRFLHEPIEVPVGEHRPTLDGAEVPLGPYVDAVVDGCERMLRLLAAHRDELLAADGPLAAFAAHPVRVLIRQTMAYANLMLDAQHPFALADGLERDRLYDRLWAITEEYPALTPLVAAERRDLLRGDVPLFTTLAGGRDLWASDGERLAGLLTESGLDAVRHRLRRLDEDEIARQVWLVANSLRGAAGVLSPPPTYELREPATAPAPGELLAAAVAVGRRLAALAFRGGEGMLWFGPEIQGGTPKTRLAPAGPDLYLGLPGIALLLAHLGAITGESSFSVLGRAAVQTLREEAAADSPLIDSLGAFSGWGGVLYTFTHLGLLWDDAALLDEAAAVAERLAPAIAGDEACDVVGGAAGCLVGLLGLWRQRPAERRLLDLAVRCGERLLARAVPVPETADGLGWVLQLAGPRPLAGFAHGAAGIAWALLQLADASGDERFRRAALRGMAYERALYSAAEGNWPDLRASAVSPDGEPHFMCAWCHGAAGIALGRLDSLRYLTGDDQARARAEAETAVATTLAIGFGKGHSLCHGDLGNLEAIALAAEVLEDAELARRGGRLAGGILADMRRHGWRNGVAAAVEAPGMMVGLAGIGYGLLRLAAPDRVPSVLRLALPAGR
jgi:type 2 lantibiotic biosynthesis protein LanM